MRKTIARAVLAAIFCFVFYSTLTAVARKGYGPGMAVLVIAAAVGIALALWWALAEVMR